MNAVIGKQACPVCGGKKKDAPAYRGPLRSGRWGSWTNTEHSVLECEACGLRWLESGAQQADFYESNAYEQTYGLEAGEAGLTYLRGDPTAELRGKTLVDFGAGSGAFLDSVREICGATIAVEPSREASEKLSRQYAAFTSAADLERSGKRADVATAFNVLEHVADPLEFLVGIRKCLKPGGKLILVTPNGADVLLGAAPAHFARHFYRTAHSFYFRAASLERALAEAGFLSVQVEYRHRYGLENLLGWLKLGKPPGAETSVFDTQWLNPTYIAEIERQGIASHLLVTAVGGNG